MTAQYEDWADWAGDHPEQAEADLRRDRERAESRAVAAFRERMGLSAETDVVVEYSAGSAAPIALIAGPTCETDGHEYNFGICLDCDQPDPAFEPDDDMIERDYLRGQFAA